MTTTRADEDNREARRVLESMLARTSASVPRAIREFAACGIRSVIVKVPQTYYCYGGYGSDLVCRVSNDRGEVKVLKVYGGEDGEGIMEVVS